MTLQLGNWSKEKFSNCPTKTQLEMGMGVYICNPGIGETAARG